MKHILALLFLLSQITPLMAEDFSPEYVSQAENILENRNKNLSFARAVEIISQGAEPNSSELKILMNLNAQLYQTKNSMVRAFDKTQETGALKPMNWHATFNYQPIEFLESRKSYLTKSFIKGGAHPTKTVYYDFSKEPELIKSFAKAVKQNNLDVLEKLPAKIRKGNLFSGLVALGLGAGIVAIHPGGANPSEFVNDGVGIIFVLFAKGALYAAWIGEKSLELEIRSKQFLLSLSQWAKPRMDTSSCKKNI